MKELKKQDFPIADKAREIIFIIDKSLKVVYVNRYAANKLHLNSEKIIGQRVTDLIPNFEEQKKSLEIVFNTNKSVYRESEFELGGKKVWLGTQLSPFEVTDGNVLSALGISRDITERKKIEENIKEKTEDLKIAQRLTKIGNWKWVIATNKVTWSDELYRINKFNPKLPVPPFAKMARFYTPESWKRLNEVVGNAFKTGKFYEVELDQIQADGTVIKTLARGEVNSDSKGKIIDLHGTVQDITERKKAEEELRRSEEWARVLVDDSNEGILRLSDKGEIVSVNRCFAEMHGYTVSEMMKMNIADLDAGESAKLAPGRIKRILAGESFVFEAQHKRKDGSIIPLEVSVSMAVIDGKKYILGFHRDITGRKKIENALKENEQKYRMLIDVTPLCIKWFDTKGNLVSVNQHAKEEHFLEGKTEEEIRKWKYIECIEEKYRDLVKESMRKALEGKSSEFDMEHVPGTSTGHWCHSYLIPATDDQEQIKYILFISRDFTKEKIAEDERNKNLKTLEKFKDLTIGRELKMVALKKEIERIKKSVGSSG